MNCEISQIPVKRKSFERKSLHLGRAPIKRKLAVFVLSENENFKMNLVR